MNFGWPEFEGPLQDPDPSSADCSTPPFVAPIYVYPNSPTDVAAVICGPRYRADAMAPYAFPSAYDGHVFVADFYGGWLRRLRPNGAGAWTLADSVAGQPSAVAWATNLSQVVDVQQGPDGALYWMSFVFGNVPRGVHRIVSTIPSAVEARPGTSHVRHVPNPARTAAEVSFEFQLAGRPENSRIRIYDPAGRLVRTLDVRGAAGTIRWDGRAQNGKPVPAGVYFYELRGAAGQAGKIVLTR
jgi:hypothetical protein